MTAYVEHALDEQRAGRQLPLVTRLRESGRIVGSTRFHDIEPWSWPAGSANQRLDRPDAVEIGYTWLAPSAQRTGVNHEAKLLMLTHAFEVWKVHRVRFRTDERNQRSRAAIERLGAQFDGIVRADRPGADDTVRHSAYYSILADEWPVVREHLMARGRRGGDGLPT
jgi:N-acetyltransferase